MEKLRYTQKLINHDGDSCRLVRDRWLIKRRNPGLDHLKKILLMEFVWYGQKNGIQYLFGQQGFQTGIQLKRIAKAGASFLQSGFTASTNGNDVRPAIVLNSRRVGFSAPPVIANQGNLV